MNRDAQVLREAARARVRPLYFEGRIVDQPRPGLYRVQKGSGEPFFANSIHTGLSKDDLVRGIHVHRDINQSVILGVIGRRNPPRQLGLLHWPHEHAGPDRLNASNTTTGPTDRAVDDKSWNKNAPIVAANLSLLLAHHGILVITAWDATASGNDRFVLSGLDAETGAALWTLPRHAITHGAISDGGLLVGWDSVSSKIICVDVTKGDVVKWQVSTAQCISFAADHYTVYCLGATSGIVVTARSLEDGSQQWARSFPGKTLPTYSTPADYGSVLVLYATAEDAGKHLTTTVIFQNQVTASVTKSVSVLSAPGGGSPPFSYTVTPTDTAIDVTTAYLTGLAAQLNGTTAFDLPITDGPDDKWTTAEMPVGLALEGLHLVYTDGGGTPLTFTPSTWCPELQTSWVSYAWGPSTLQVDATVNFYNAPSTDGPMLIDPGWIVATVRRNIIVKTSQMIFTDGSIRNNATWQASRVIRVWISAETGGVVRAQTLYTAVTAVGGDGDSIGAQQVAPTPDGRGKILGLGRGDFPWFFLARRSATKRILQALSSSDGTPLWTWTADCVTDESAVGCVGAQTGYVLVASSAGLSLYQAKGEGISPFPPRTLAPAIIGDALATQGSPVITGDGRLYFLYGQAGNPLALCRAMDPEA